MLSFLSAFLLTFAVSSPATAGEDRENSSPAPSEDSILRFLETAEVVASEEITTGITKPLRLTLSDGVTTRDAVFRTIDRTEIDRRRDGQLVRIRDHWAFEVAAYRLARRLDLERVPPTTVRQLDGREGSIQLWVKDASGGTDLVVRSAERGPEGIAERDAVLTEMALFDLLIRNYDRHLNNVLYDAQGRFWWIDHSRSFPPTGKLRTEPTREQCQLPLVERLRELEPRALRDDLRGLLSRREIGALLQRRSEILDLCAQGGAEASSLPTTF